MSYDKQPKHRQGVKSYAPTNKAKIGEAKKIDGKKFMNKLNSLGQNPGVKK